MGPRKTIARSVAAAAATALMFTASACSSSGGGSTSGSSAGGQQATTVPGLNFGSSTSTTPGPDLSYQQVAKLKSIASAGKGKIAVLLPNTSLSRFVTADAPSFDKAFAAAGLSSDQYSVQNAQGSPETQLTQAQAAITGGASVLILDALGFGTGTAIEKYAKAHGVPVIDYDSVVVGGQASYFVTFDNTQVGKLIGEGEVSCIQAWHVQNPHIFELNGEPGDPVSEAFTNGYNSVLAPYYQSSKYTKVGEQWTPNWNPQQGETLFTQAYQAHPDINAAVTANDGLAEAVVSALKARRIPAHTFPTTGQDATLQGLQNILAGYQCMTVYKPIYEEASAAAALAIILRGRLTPPSSLINSTTSEGQGHSVPTVMLTPVSVATTNMKATVVKDGFVSTAQLCSGSYAKLCADAGITS